MKKLLFVILTLTLFAFSAVAQTMERDMQDQKKSSTTGTEQPANLSVKKNLSSGDLIGSEVFKDNSKIGEIKDVVINRDNGNVKDVIISMGGVLGMGEKYYLVPWNKLSFNQNRIESQMTKSEIEATPSRSSLDNIDEWSQTGASSSGSATY